MYPTAATKITVTEVNQEESLQSGTSASTCVVGRIGKPYLMHFDVFVTCSQGINVTAGSFCFF